MTLDRHLMPLPSSIMWTVGAAPMAIRQVPALLKGKGLRKRVSELAWSEGRRFWCSKKDGDEDVNVPDSSRGDTSGSA
jgi:hypothetical protein